MHCVLMCLTLSSALFLKQAMPCALVQAMEVYEDQKTPLHANEGQRKQGGGALHSPALQRPENRCIFHSSGLSTAPRLIKSQTYTDCSSLFVPALTKAPSLSDIKDYVCVVNLWIATMAS